MFDETTSTVTTTEAGADTQSQTAEAGGNQEVTTGATEAETRTAEGEKTGDADTTTQEDAENATEENKDKGAHQKTLEERAEEIADRKIQQRIAEAEERRQAETAARPDFIPVDYQAYDNHIAQLFISERALTEELALEPDNPLELVRKIRAIQAERNTLETAFNANEQKRQAWTLKQQEAQKQTEFQQAVQGEIARTVDTLAKSRGVSPEMLEAGRKRANEALKADPALQKRFDDIITHKATYQGFSGVDAAVEMLWTRTSEEMSKKAEGERQKKEGGKDKVLPGGGETVAAGFANIHKFSDLMNLPSKEINQFAKDHPKRFEELKKRHFK